VSGPAKAGCASPLLDHDLLDSFLDCVLTRHKRGTYDLAQARGELAHAITAIAKENPNFRQFMRAIIEKKDC
jgi:hypothetical protein